jgi:NAD(P)-dependent dehydrogenase (short-subunit alcohol dehydrogenase family)
MSHPPFPTSRRAYSRRRALATGGAAALAGAAGGAAIAPVAQPTPPARRFAGKVVLITGATSGIGRAAAVMFAAEGGLVGFCGRREQLGHEVERTIRAAGGEATYLRADVRDEAQVQRFVDDVVVRYGGLDVCFNNAGITVEKPLHEYTSAEFDDVLDTDLRGVFLSLKYQIPHLLRRGGGSVVVTASSNAISTNERRAAYTAAKRGLLGLVDSAAFDYADDNIRINTLIPGTTNTDLVRRVAGASHLPDQAWNQMAADWGRANVPGMRRMATPDEIAAAALALASDEFPYMTAAKLVVDGGKSAYA